jgi:N-acetylated-alpha-linked acidic dipeptidase
VPAYDVIARARGRVYPDEWIVRGNHHDAWAFGAADPVSGMVALLEEARAIGALMRSGWRPQRTIVFAAWDAEEPGLLGSTEWAEAHAEALRRHAVAYINTDGSGRGFLGAGGSHTLERLVSEVAAEVPDPQTGVSVAERLRARLRVEGRREEADRADLELYPLGSGSDYTPFLQHLGIASLNLGYGGESDGGEYHSIYDSFDHYRRFGDPTFAYGVTLVKTAGRVTLRLSEAPVLPLRVANLAERVGRYVREVMELEQHLREETERRNALVASGAYRLAADPTRTFVAPDSMATVPYLNFAPLRNAADRLAARATAADSAITRAPAGSPAVRGALNGLLARTERAMTRTEGLPRRPWFRHQVYAPGFYTGYGVKTLPGVREALEERKWAEAEAQIASAAAALDALSAVLAEIVATGAAGS